MLVTNMKNNQTINIQHLHAILGNRSSYEQAFISVPPHSPPLRKNQPCAKESKAEGHFGQYEEPKGPRSHECNNNQTKK